MEVSEWRDRHGGRITVGLTTAVAALSILVGIVNITPTPLRPYPGVVPSVASPVAEQIAAFTGVLTGFLVLTAAFALRHGLRSAWYATLVLLPVTALQGLVQASPHSLLLVVLSLVAFPVVFANGGRYDRPTTLTDSQLAAGAALVGVQLYGTVGTYALRDEFRGVVTPMDALYYTLVTSSTVGYGDATPTTQSARLFGMSIVVFGAASFALALGTLLGPAIEARLARALGRMTTKELELLEDHVLVLGYGRLLTESILTDMADRTSFLVVTENEEAVVELSDRDLNVLSADPSDDEVLQRAGVERARAVVVATSDDAEDALAVLTARHLSSDIRIVAAAAERENVEKLRRAGADVVVSPAVIGRLVVESALDGREGESTVGPTDVEADE
ncbi:NAD-binding protein [Halomicrococcus sp. SG-WS-1]|uniref:NAD-binding protein n=1 Tax=Halomicrococcus sp. SG-WS-1 TaxID=3439057 RepID=UPI003F7AC109